MQTIYDELRLSLIPCQALLPPDNTKHCGRTALFLPPPISTEGGDNSFCFSHLDHIHLTPDEWLTAFRDFAASHSHLANMSLAFARIYGSHDYHFAFKEDTTFERMTLAGASLMYADAVHAIFKSTAILDETQFIDCRLNGARFFCKLDGTSFVRCTMKDVAFLPEPQQARSELAEMYVVSLLKDCHFTSVTFEDCDLSRAMFVDARISACNFDPASAKGLILNGGCFVDMDFTKHNVLNVARIQDQPVRLIGVKFPESFRESYQWLYERGLINPVSVQFVPSDAPQSDINIITPLGDHQVRTLADVVSEVDGRVARCTFRDSRIENGLSNVYAIAVISLLIYILASLLSFPATAASVIGTILVAYIIWLSTPRAEPAK